ncbi:protein inturned-like isoform X2 [Gigantopelta aegis]|nr:protein inturned-like isoform X2 [Gigantopelta aegis]
MDSKGHSGKYYQVVISVNPGVSTTLQSYKTACEQLLGIVPGIDGVNGKSVSRGCSEKKDVIVKGFLPDGPAVKLTNIHINDSLKKINGVSVTWDNIDKILSTISSPQQVKLTLQRNAWTSPRLEPKPALFSDDLVSLLTSSKVNGWLSGTDNSLCVLYVSMEGMTSDDVLDKEDLLYHFPPQEQIFSAVRGMFYTLSHVLKELGKFDTKISTVVLNDERVHVSYYEEDKNLLLITVPAHKLSASLLSQFTVEIVRLIRVLLGSLDTAFKHCKHHPLLNELFSLVVRCHFSASPGDQNCYPSPLVRSLCQSSEVQYLPLCDDIMLYIGNMLSDFEAAEFVDMSDTFYGCRRSYTILGSALFYKGYLLCSHLSKADLSDVYLYLKYHCLLSLTGKHSISQLVIWRQVFPSRFCDDVSQINSNFGYSEPHAQWFLLIVGLKHGLFATILEAGGCASQIQGQPQPDPFYIDQARSTLMQAQTIHVVSHCESRLAGEGLPMLSVADDYITKTTDKLIQSLTAKTSDDLLKNSLSLPPGIVSLRPVLSSTARKQSVESDGSSGSGSNDGLFKSNRKTRLFPNASELTPLIQDISLANTMCSKITSGKSNCLFHYIHNDVVSGVCITPPVTSRQSLPHAKLLHNFYRCSAQIKNMFTVSTQRKDAHSDEEPLFDTDSGLRNIREYGVLFHDDHHVITDGKKSTSSLCYWVVGRRFSRPVKRELYVCFHESTPQNLVEMAFHLGFSLLNPG